MDEKTAPGGTRPWSIEGPRVGTISPEVRALQSAWYGQLVSNMTYSLEELEALHGKDAVASWSPAEDAGLHSPLSVWHRMAASLAQFPSMGAYQTAPGSSTMSFATKTKLTKA
jgi:hypothetical protein